MLFFPYQTFEVQTYHNIPDLVQHLSCFVVASAVRESDFPPEVEYVGHVDEQGFRLRPLEYANKQYRPVIVGHFLQSGPGTIVTINIRLTWGMISVLAGYSMIFIIAIPVCFLVDLLTRGIPPGGFSVDQPWVLVGGIMPLLAMWLFFWIGYRIDARPNKKRLIDLLTNQAEQ
jgi:hypothetical protein